MSHKSSDYKLSAVKYYLSNDTTLKDTCDIFQCKQKSLFRWVKRYLSENNVQRKTTSKDSYKVTEDIEKEVVKLVKKNITLNLCDIVFLIDKKFNVRLSDQTIYRILKKNNYTRKRIRSKYYRTLCVIKNRTKKKQI